MAFWNIYYGTVHFVLPVVTLVWLYRKAPGAVRAVAQHARPHVGDRGASRSSLYPLMPPRLMPARYDFVDTAAEYYNFGPQVKVEFGADGQPTERALAQYGNPFAAMPSFHVGWSTWCVLALWPLVRRRWLRALARRLRARRALLHHRDREPLAARRGRRAGSCSASGTPARAIDRSNGAALPSARLARSSGACTRLTRCGRRWWRRWDSNPRPPACKAGALAS